MRVLDIGEVSRLSGVAASALRYYEEVGLIASIGRHGLRRQFGPEVLTQLSLIAMGKTAGFALPEIAAMFAADGRLAVPRDDLHAKANELDRQIKRLTALRSALRHVADCPAQSHLQCPNFQRLLHSAGRRRRQRRSVRIESVG